MISNALRARATLANKAGLFKPATFANFASSDKPLVTITGLDGFVGPHTALEFLKTGDYRVRATVRKNADKGKMAEIKSAYGSLYQDLEIVEAELLEEDSMIKAIEGSTYVAHLASPYYLDNKTRDELVGPAVNGTLGAMKACTHWGVKRCVFTSSYACIRWTAKEDAPPDNVYTEKYWSNPDRPEGMGDYAASKVLAELAGWDYQKKNPGFEVVTICPTLILGPGIGRANVVSEEFVHSILKNFTPNIKCASNYYVDVRDVAKAHVRAIQVPEAKNQRFMVHGDEATKENIRDMLTELYGSQGYKPGCDTIDDVGAQGVKNDNSAAKKVLGMDFIPLKTTLKDMTDAMIR
jgi:dihydroflavonol-4-reductase